MDRILDTLTPMPWWRAAFWLLLINVAVFVLSLASGELLVRAFTGRRVAAPPDPLDRWEVIWAAVCVVLNGGVAFAGWVLWRAGLIVVRRDAAAWRVVLDVLVLLLAMDFLMYVFHRLAHHRWVFPVVHSTHHRYDKPRPLNLFVLNPFEVLGFGALWLAVIALYPTTWGGHADLPRAQPRLRHPRPPRRRAVPPGNCPLAAAAPPRLEHVPRRPPPRPRRELRLLHRRVGPPVRHRRACDRLRQ